METPYLEARVRKLTESVDIRSKMVEEYQTELKEEITQAEQLLTEAELEYPEELAELAELDFDFDPDNYDLEGIVKQLEAKIQELGENVKKLDGLFELLATCKCGEFNKEVDELYSKLAEEDSDWEDLDEELLPNEEDKVEEPGDDEVKKKEETPFDVLCAEMHGEGARYLH